VTNSHVVPGSRAEVVTWDDHAHSAEVVARDAVGDLALLRFHGDPLPALGVGDSTAVRVGQLVLAVGNPWGQRGAVTAGIVMSRGSEHPENRVPLAEVIRADIRLAPGNSGGPLTDARGRVVGINSMVAGGMAIAIPANAVARFVRQTTEGRGVLGISARAVPLPAGVAALLPGEAGLLILDVAAQSPAERSGVLPGDILIAIDGQGGGIEPLARSLRALRSGAAVQLDLLRGERVERVEAVPARAA
jgi:serine protease Do